MLIGKWPNDWRTSSIVTRALGDHILSTYIDECEKFEEQFQDEFPMEDIRKIAIHQVERTSIPHAISITSRDSSNNISIGSSPMGKVTFTLGGFRSTTVSDVSASQCCSHSGAWR